MLLIAAVSVVVIGPKDLPRALHAAGKIIRKIKTVSSDIQKSLDKIMEESELEEITRAANRAGGDNVQQMVERQLARESNRPAIDVTAVHVEEETGPEQGDEDLRYDLDDDEDGDAGEVREPMPTAEKPLQNKDSEND